MFCLEQIDEQNCLGFCGFLCLQIQMVTLWTSRYMQGRPKTSQEGGPFLMRWCCLSTMTFLNPVITFTVITFPQAQHSSGTSLTSALKRVGHTGTRRLPPHFPLWCQSCCLLKESGAQPLSRKRFIFFSETFAAF